MKVALLNKAGLKGIKVHQRLKRGIFYYAVRIVLTRRKELPEGMANL